MRYEIVLSPGALDDLRSLSSAVRAKVKGALEMHLRHEPTKLSRSRIKRRRGISRPQYRLRVDDVRVFYDVTNDLSRYLREAESREIVITRHGKPAGVLIGFGSEDDWFDYRLENDSRFRKRIASARQSLREGRGVRLEEIDS